MTAANGSAGGGHAQLEGTPPWRPDGMFQPQVAARMQCKRTATARRLLLCISGPHVQGGTAEDAQGVCVAALRPARHPAAGMMPLSGCKAPHQESAWIIVLPNPAGQQQREETTAVNGQGGGESLDQLQHRAHATVTALAARHPGQTIALVVHGACYMFAQSSCSLPMHSHAVSRGGSWAAAGGFLTAVYRWVSVPAGCVSMCMEHQWLVTSLIRSLLTYAGKRLANLAQHETRTAHSMLSWSTVTASGRCSHGATSHTCGTLTSPPAPLVAMKLAEREKDMLPRVLRPPAQHHHIDPLIERLAVWHRLCVGHMH